MNATDNDEREREKKKKWLAKIHSQKPPQIEYILYASTVDIFRRHGARASTDLNTQYHVSKHF